MTLLRNSLSTQGLNIAVCDDNECDAKELTAFIEEFCRVNNYEAFVEIFSNGEKLLLGVKRTKFPIIFLDIYMCGIQGVEVARRLRENDNDCAILFTTSSSEHFHEGFEVQATHYLLKPIKKADVFCALKRCESIFCLGARYIQVKDPNKLLQTILLRDILYAEVYDKKCVIHTILGNVEIRSSLDELIKLLDDRRFLRCHKSYLVNLQHVQSFKGNMFIMSDNSCVPARSNNLPALRQAYNDYLFSIARDIG